MLAKRMNHVLCNTSTSSIRVMVQLISFILEHSYDYFLLVNYPRLDKGLHAEPITNPSNFNTWYLKGEKKVLNLPFKVVMMVSGLV